MKYVYKIVPVIDPEIGYSVKRGWQSEGFFESLSLSAAVSWRQEGFFKTREEAQKAIDHLRDSADSGSPPHA